MQTFPLVDRCFSTRFQRGRELHLLAAVLHLRGDRLCAQPAEDAHGNVLLWNGEVGARGIKFTPLET